MYGHTVRGAGCGRVFWAQLPEAPTQVRSSCSVTTRSPKKKAPCTPKAQAPEETPHTLSLSLSLSLSRTDVWWGSLRTHAPKRAAAAKPGETFELCAPKG